MDSKANKSGGRTESYISRLVVMARERESEALPSDFQAHFSRPVSQWKDICTEDVEHNPTLQSALAHLLDYPPSKWLLEQEAPLLRRIRAIHSPDEPLPEYVDGGLDVYHWARIGKLTGLCFSGGGIRSATFNLGILQGLALRDRLNEFDYLSSVSGGGYIHAWLAAWLNHQAEVEYPLPQTPGHNDRAICDQAMRSGFQRVSKDLCPPPKHSPKTWPIQIEWLRRYSNYLTPDVGLFTGDTWAMVATWLRNVSLNQSLLLSLFALLLMLPHLLATHDWVIPPSVFVTHNSQTIATVRAPHVDAALVFQLNTPARTAIESSSHRTRVSYEDNSIGHQPSVWLAERVSWSGLIGLCALGLSIAALCFLLHREYERTRGQDELERDVRAAAKRAAEATRESVAAAEDLQKAREAHGASGAGESDKNYGARLATAEDRMRRAAKEEETASEKAKHAEKAAENRTRSQRIARLAYEWWIVLGMAIVPLFVFGTFISHYVISDGSDLGVFAAALLMELTLLVWIGTFSGGALTEWNVRSESEQAIPPSRVRKLIARAWHTLVLMAAGAPAAVVGTLGGIGIALLLRSSAMNGIAGWLYLSGPQPVQMVFGVVLFAWLPLVVLVIAAGLVGRWFPNWLGEWLARIRGYTLIAGLAWIILCGTSLLMPGVVTHASHSGWIKWSAVLTWAGTTIASVLFGKSSKTSGEKGSSAPPNTFDSLLLVGPYVYMLGLLVALAWILNTVQEHFSSGRLFWLLCFVVPAFVTVVFGFTLDLNEFSMHSFYRNRLTRCYLGASNLHRDPSRVTGFDDRDTRGLQIARLLPEGDGSDRRNLYPGPFPIFCCSMNITHGEDLGWQERKAASFAFTPLYSGYDVPWFEGSRSKRITYNGYVSTRHYAYPGGPNLATAMATSGAAISPNWGYHTNPGLAFLLTMFDVRLGWWIPNPRRSPLAGQQSSSNPVELDHPSPLFAPIWLVQELLGSITDTSAYVYLTDGGHFDNMGLYELVRRRCYGIVICDAEEDSSYTYEGIGNAIRKCRVDFGAEIDLDLSNLKPNSESKLSPAQVVYGTIRYPETPAKQEEAGRIIYVKASLTGKGPSPSPQPPIPGEVKLPDVPGDVQNYKLQHDAFPHDSTVNQWFTESQFESYRRLGQTAAECIVWK